MGTRFSEHDKSMETTNEIPQFQSPEPKLWLLLMLDSLRDYENEKKEWKE